MASHFKIPEVMIFFGHKLIRGNRSTKVSSNNLVAFDSNNHPYLGEMGTTMKIAWDFIL